MKSRRSFREEYPYLSEKALKITLPFLTAYMREASFFFSLTSTNTKGHKTFHAEAV